MPRPEVDGRLGAADSELGRARDCQEIFVDDGQMTMPRPVKRCYPVSACDCRKYFT